MIFGRKNKDFAKAAIDAVIVGLGNPESKYDRTRHNAGFMAIDRLCEKYGVRLSKMKFKAIYNTAEIDGMRIMLVKPQTYMNNSGESVSEILRFYKIGLDKLIVLCDDISLDVGKLRIRAKGSDGGQRGVRSIIELVGSQDFTRIKIGIGNKPNPDYDLADWVLSRFRDDETEPLDTALKNAAAAAVMIAGGNIDRAMNKYNS